MEIDVCPASLGLQALPMRSMEQMGRVVEDRIIEAIVLSAQRPVEGFRPVTDTGGYDWAGCPDGLYDALRLEQFKGTLHLIESGRVEIIFTGGPLHPRRNTQIVFAHYDLEQRRIVDPLWVVPSQKLPDVATQQSCRYHNARHWHFNASPSGTSRDAAARYQVGQRELAGALFPTVERLAFPVPTLPPSSRERGGFFEAGFQTRFLRDASGMESLSKPDPDLGRDFLGLVLEPFAWGSLAVKGIAAALPGGVITVHIRGETFHPHRRHFVLVQYFDEAEGRLHPVSWFIPSIAFARLASRKVLRLRMSTNLHGTRNRWSPFVIPTEDDARTFMRAMRHPPIV